MAPRSELNGTSAPAGNLNANEARMPILTNGTRSPVPTMNGDSDSRPSSLPGRRNGAQALATRDDIESQRAARPSKPSLIRSKSEFAHRYQNEPEHTEDDIPEWGARHGFEDHYQSEDIISQLANVS